MQLLTNCNICDPQFDGDGAVYSFSKSKFKYSNRNTNKIIYIQVVKWRQADELLVFSEENGQYSLLGFHDFVEFQNEECNVYDPDKDSVVFANDTIMIFRGNSVIKFRPNDCSLVNSL